MNWIPTPPGNLFQSSRRVRAGSIPFGIDTYVPSPGPTPPVGFALLTDPLDGAYITDPSDGAYIVVPVA